MKAAHKLLAVSIAVSALVACSDMSDYTNERSKGGGEALPLTMAMDPYGQTYGETSSSVESSTETSADTATCTVSPVMEAQQANVSTFALAGVVAPTADMGTVLGCMLDLGPSKVAKLYDCVTAAQGDASSLAKCAGSIGVPDGCLNLIVGAAGDLYKSIEKDTKFIPAVQADKICAEERAKYCNGTYKNFDELYTATQAACNARFVGSYPYGNDTMKAQQWANLCADVCKKGGNWPNPMPSWTY